jgi:twitching motility protein PilJ
MQQNLLLNLLTKLASLLAIVFSIFAAVLVVSSYLTKAPIGFAAILCAVFAALLVAFAVVAANVSIFKMGRLVGTAEELAGQIANGELISEDVETGHELIVSLQQISDYLHSKALKVDQIATGDLSVSVALRSDTDFFGKSLQNMIEKLRLLVQTEEERDRLQNSIIKLLREVSEVAEGDLTVRAEVSSEMTGEIAVAFNHMTKELRSLIKQVKDVTFQVSSSANSINDTTEQLAKGSEAQASQISRTTTAISNMALQIQEVSNNASLSAQVAGDSLNNARYGSKAMQDNINAMNGIRNQVQETAKRIKKLGERSQEISQIVQLIDDLSDRTSLLALNASLQASAAGEAGIGFGFVAEEVERLAERSNRLTQQIANLTRTIQFETKEVVASMEETIHEVVVGSTLADKAGSALVEIEQVSTRLAELIQSISESAKRQATSAEDISNAMTNISKVTELVNVGSKRAADSVKLLVELSDELRGSVAPFKLPEDSTPQKRSLNESNGLYVN